jgi:anti-sigma regulatory factor (Ser/Thr protein kinase)
MAPAGNPGIVPCGRRPELTAPLEQEQSRVVSDDPDVELTLPAEPDSVALARQMVRGIVDALGWSEETRTDISIAVTEACTNCVLHAYPEGEPGDYEVFAWIDDDRLVVTVRDHGRGISPRLPSPAAGLGLGLPLILAIGEEVSFSEDDDSAGAEVRMVFTAESRQARA